jgi:hypothetical protein
VRQCANSARIAVCNTPIAIEIAAETSIDGIRINIGIGGGGRIIVVATKVAKHVYVR